MGHWQGENQAVLSAVHSKCWQGHGQIYEESGQQSGTISVLGTGESVMSASICLRWVRMTTWSWKLRSPFRSYSRPCRTWPVERLLALPIFLLSSIKVFGKDLTDVCRDSLDRGWLPLSCRRAVLILLTKKGDVQNTKYWQPVALLCTDKLGVPGVSQQAGEGYGAAHPSRLNILCTQQVDNSTSLWFVMFWTSLDLWALSLVWFLLIWKMLLWQTLPAFRLSPGHITTIQILDRDIESVHKINGGLRV